MEPVRFADILFIVLVLAITFGILALVNRKRKTDEKPADTEPESTEASVAEKTDTTSAES